MTCVFCKRTDVDSAQVRGYVYRPITVTEGTPPIRFSVDNMCVDCADVVEHFIRSGIKAWRESLRNHDIGQLDLFEDAELPPISRFLNSRTEK